MRYYATSFLQLPGVLLLVLLVLGLVTAQPAPAQVVPPVPDPPRLVNDFTLTLLTADETTLLEKKLSDFNRETGYQVAVVVVDDMGGAALEPYATTLFNAWGIGEKGKDNGVLVLLTMKERKIRIEVGLGAENVLSDDFAAGVIQRDMVPNFRLQQFYAGLDAATTSIISKVRKDAPNAKPGLPASNRVGKVKH